MYFENIKIVKDMFYNQISIYLKDMVYGKDVNDT